MKSTIAPKLTRTTLALSAALLLSACSLDPKQWFSRSAPDADAPAASAAQGTLYLLRARQAFERGDYGIAINLLELELGQNNDSVAALNGLGASYDQLGRHDVARRYYFRALDLAPDSDMTLANLAYSYQLEGRPADSLRVYELALSQAPDNSLALAQLPQVQEQAAQQALAAPEPVQVDGSLFANAERSPLLVDRPALLQVVNGNGVRGIAAATASAVDTGQFRVTGLDNVPGYDIQRSRILHRPYFRDRAEQLANALAVEAALQESTLLDNDVDLRLVLGHDFARQVIIANEQLQRRPALALDSALRLEVVNGNGVNGMAARVREYLRDKGGSVVRIANAEHFQHDRSVIYYRSGQRQQVEGLLSTLPLHNVSLLESDELAANVDVRVLLGRDYIAYDAG